MAAGFFDLGKIGNGRLLIGPRPQATELHDWSARASGLGVNHVVSLIEKSEVKQYHLKDEGPTLAAVGISFQHFPVDDFDVPDEGAFATLIAGLAMRLQEGETLFLHCAGGVGRAGTTASCIMVDHGWTADDAMRHVSDRRGVPSPETAAQAEFVGRRARRELT